MGLIDDAIDQATDTADTVGDAADTAVGGTVDTVLDNDVVSVQEAVQGTVTGAYNLAPGGQNRSQDYVFDQLAGLTSSASENVGNAINDTPLDNPATDAAVWAGDAVVGAPARAAVGTVTGRDYGSGEDNYRPSAVEAAELALVGAGPAVAKTAKGGSKLTNRLGTALRGGDDAAAGSDEVATTVDEVTGGSTTISDDLAEEATTVDEVTGGLTSISDNLVDDATTVDEVAGESTTIAGRGDITVVDETTESADDALDAFNTGTATRSADDVVETTVRAGDDVAETTARTGDESGALIDDAIEPARVGDDGAPRWADAAFRGGDDAAPALDDLSPAARGADDTAEAAARTGEDVTDDSSGLLSRFTPDSSRGRAGALLGGGVLTGAAVTTAFSDEEVPDEFTATDANGTQYTFVVSGRLRPENSDKFDSGATLYTVSQEQSTQGYWVVFGADGDGNLILLGPNGNKRTSTLTPAQFENSLPGAPQSEGQS